MFIVFSFSLFVIVQINFDDTSLIFYEFQKENINILFIISKYFKYLSFLIDSCRALQKFIFFLKSGQAGPSPSGQSAPSFSTEGTPSASNNLNLYYFCNWALGQHGTAAAVRAALEAGEARLCSDGKFPRTCVMRKWTC